jgi:hypothetical protein
MSLYYYYPLLPDPNEIRLLCLKLDKYKTALI